MNARYWPHLHEAKAGGVLPHVKTDFTRWTWEGDPSDDVINARTVSDTNKGRHLLVILPQTSDKYNFLLMDKSGQSLIIGEYFSATALNALEK
jgi:hypothetical protein